MISQFLPASYDPHATATLIAGRGDYPCLVAERIRAQGIPLRLIAFEEETSPALVQSFAGSDRVVLKVGQVGALLKSLKKFGARFAIMAGQITPRKLFKGLHPDVKAILMLARLKEKNAESIFGAIAKEIEAIDCRLLDARAFLDDQLATPGVMVGKWSQKEEWLSHGISIAKEIAGLDIGQGIVVNQGTVLAVEAFEGTDKMLQRAGTFEAPSALFVKTVKRKQDYRFDVPILGLQTLDILADAHIRSVAVQANATLLLRKESVLESARKKGIAILGYEAGG